MKRLLLIPLVLFYLSNLLIAQSIESIDAKIDSVESKIQELNKNQTIIERKISNLLDEKRNLFSIKNELLLESNQLTEYVVNLKIDGKIRESSTPISDLLYTIPAGTEAIVYNKIEGGVFKAKYNNEIGYINDMYLDKNSFPKELNDYIKLAKDVANQSYLIKKNKKKKNRREQLEKKYGKLYSRFIFRGSIKIGMTQQMVKESIGSPKDINKSVYSFGVHEQWVYSHNKYEYLYFEDGILTSWQE